MKSNKKNSGKPAEQVTVLKEPLRAAQVGRGEAEGQPQPFQQPLLQLEEQFSAQQVSFRKAVDQLEAAKKQLAQLHAESEALRSRTGEQQKKIEELTRNLQRAEDKQHQAEQRLIKTRASMTYQLGYQLKSGATSVDGLVRLPRSLFKLYREASRKRKNASQVSINRPAPIPSLPNTQQPGVSTAVLKRPGPVVLEREPEARKLMAKPRSAAMRVACIMDEFSYGSYRHEGELYQLTPTHWQQELQDFQPDMLLIESAWRGKDALWGSKVGHNSQELQGIIAWCRTNGVPTAFWNKEDPVHFETFLTTARQFDHVFTTDIDCIHRYKAALGHERVYLLPFACQPAVHNPIELYQRKDAFCFAGAYYVRYPDRIRDLQTFIAELPKFRPLEIYDRNFGKDDPNYQFPAEYQPYIMGKLPFGEIDKAYKGYRYAINLNSIKQSQSMFARRVFELLGSNTITVSNFSRGVRLLFGDLVISTDNGPEMLRRLNLLSSDEESSGKLRLAGLRKVMQEHTYAQRIDYVLGKVLGRPSQHTLPPVAVLSRANDAAALDRLLANVKRQHLKPLRVCVLVSKHLKAQTSVDEAWLELVTEPQLKERCVRDVVGEASLVAGLWSDDYYGPNYLLDIVLATRYSGAGVIGKAAHYASEEGRIRLHDATSAYSPVGSLAIRASAIETSRVAAQPLRDWFNGLEDGWYREKDALAIDPYNYCRAGACAAGAPEIVDDLALDTGITIGELQARAEAIPASRNDQNDAPILNGNALEALFGPSRSKSVRLALDGSFLEIDSSLADGTHEYVYAAKELTPAELGNGRPLKLFLDATPGLNLQVVLLMLDAQKQRISHVMGHANRNITAEIPPETAFIRLGWRVYASGSTMVKGLLLGHRDLQSSAMLERSRHLLLTNNYPAYDDLYRNGFVHSRVRAYREQGVAVDVFRLRKGQPVSYHEFENVDVITGSPQGLDQMLASGRFDSVLVHFLDPDMWAVLRKHMDRVRVVVWVHGAEIQPWWRREYNYRSEEQLQLGKLESDRRLAFWRELLQPMPANLHLVFVSRYFAEEVMEDLGFRLSEAQYSIIHNPINTELFSYQPKSRDQRGKILSIRPYASATYANDLSAKAIEHLAKRPFFRDLEFRMIGDGPLFDEILEPLRKYPNVIIERGFLTQPQIAALHKEYGVFLCPSRMDTQGVSRDEAMASGLVPITSRVSAIPEFVDSDCAYLDDPEAFLGLAAAIETLYLNPDEFSRKSEASGQRVSRQSAKDAIIARELQLVR